MYIYKINFNSIILKINQNIIPEDFTEQFLNTGSAVIRDFLIPEFADELYNFFNFGMPDDWWYSTSFPGLDGLKFLRNFPENQDLINLERVNSENLFNQGQFTYHFFRTAGDHYQHCNCSECIFRQWLNSEESIGFLSRVSKVELKNFNTIFASRYSSGCFLSPHHDDSLGKVGFVLQLTKNWRPQWGGVLHFLDDSMSLIEYSEVPTFNTLTLFHIPEGKGKWHYVSHVAPGVTSHRIAYSGWFS